MQRRKKKYPSPGSRRPKRGGGWLWIVVAVIVGAGLGWGLFQWLQSRAPAPHPQPPIAASTSAPPARLVEVVPTPQTSPPIRVVQQPPPPRPLPETNVEPLPSNVVPQAVTVTNVEPVRSNVVVQPVVVTNIEPGRSNGFPRPVQNLFEAQVALARHGVSPGSLDGLNGPQTRAALRAYQQQAGLPTTGQLDEETTCRLLLAVPPCSSYTVTSNDLARLQPLSSTWLGKSQQTALDYETILELVAEKGQASPSLIRRLNPGINWNNVGAGAVLQIPAADYSEVRGKAAFVTIRLAARVLEAFDAHTNLLVHFPCSIAQRVEKRPVGELHVVVIAPNPNYTFDPDVFPESEEAQQLKTKLVLPPGPNNPVGVAWIGLDRPGYGIHGTPSPEQVGRTESHGCFRLANWNAAFLVRLVNIGTRVYVEP